MDTEPDTFDDLLSAAAELRTEAEMLRDECANLESIEEAHVDDFVAGLDEAETLAKGLLKAIRDLRKRAKALPR